MLDRSWVEKIASGDERPFIQMLAPEMLEHARANWDDVFCLYSIVAEAQIRVRKNPGSKASEVLEMVTPRLTEMLSETFPDDPNPDPGGGDFANSDSWPKVGLLKHMGYTTGADDPGTAERRNILRLCFNGPIPNVDSPEYMRGWGSNKSPRRLSKMAWSLATFASNKIKMNDGRVDAASRSWKDDLAWLRVEFYEGHFGFPWPPLD